MNAPSMNNNLEQDDIALAEQLQNANDAFQNAVENADVDTVNSISADPDDVPSASMSNKNKKSKLILGLPKPAFFIVVGFIVFTIVGIIIVIASKGSTNNRQPTSTQVATQAQMQRTAELNALNEKAQSAITIADGATKDIAQLRQDMDAKIAASEYNGVDSRILELEKKYHDIEASIASLKRQIKNNRPLSDNLVTNKSARIVSIGGGVARVVDEYGEEFSLHKGDKWEDAVVLYIRADQRRVILSNGTVIQ